MASDGFPVGPVEPDGAAGVVRPVVGEPKTWPVVVDVVTPCCVVDAPVRLPAGTEFAGSGAWLAAFGAGGDIVLPPWAITGVAISSMARTGKNLVMDYSPEITLGRPNVGTVR